MIEGKRSPSDEVVMEMLSERYGWTPSQIREQSKDDLNYYIRIISIKNRLEKAKAKKYAR